GAAAKGRALPGALRPAGAARHRGDRLMAAADDIQEDEYERSKRPPRAVVGSHKLDEEVFGKAFDANVVRRIWDFVRPYRRLMLSSVAAVLAFTAIQLMIPLIIRYAIDHGMQSGADGRVLA